MKKLIKILKIIEFEFQKYYPEIRIICSDEDKSIFIQVYSILTQQLSFNLLVEIRKKNKKLFQNKKVKKYINIVGCQLSDEDCKRLIHNCN